MDFVEIEYHWLKGYRSQSVHAVQTKLSKRLQAQKKSIVEKTQMIERKRAKINDYQVVSAYVDDAQKEANSRLELAKREAEMMQQKKRNDLAKSIETLKRQRDEELQAIKLKHQVEIDHLRDESAKETHHLELKLLDLQQENREMKTKIQTELDTLMSMMGIEIQDDVVEAVEEVEVKDSKLISMDEQNADEIKGQYGPFKEQSNVQPISEFLTPQETKTQIVMLDDFFALG